MNPVALVTGASAGIGSAFARELAARGHDLVLTARRADRLDALAEELRRDHAVAAHCIPLDLAESDAPNRLAGEVARLGLQVDLLVNNAGYGVTGSFVSRTWSTHADFTRVLVVAPTELCHRLLPGMRARRRGRIINVASLAGLLPAPAGHTLYAASKAWLIRFSQALALENRAHGIHVCALCPGFTWSEFHDVTGTRERMHRLPRWLWMDAASVARDGEALRFAGVLSRECVPALWRRALPLVAGARSFDLAGVARIDSAGVALLAELAARAGAGVAIAGNPPGLSELRAAYRLQANLGFA